jgi:hypothetical protein
MSDFQHFLTEDRRLFILRLLEQCGGEANESVIHSACRAAGHHVTRDVVREDGKWLKERDLVKLDYYDEKVMVVLVTARGVDVARGDLEVEGVKRPAIGR